MNSRIHYRAAFLSISLPKGRRGGTRIDYNLSENSDNAILYVLRTGCAWRDLPEKYGDDATAHRHLQRWQSEGVWQHIHRMLLGMLERLKRIDWSSGLLDGSFVPAKKGAIASA